MGVLIRLGKVGQGALRANPTNYLLNDLFVPSFDAGNVDGTISLPGPGTRTVIDTGNLESIIGGVLAIQGLGLDAWGDPRLTYAALTKTPGYIMTIRDLILRQGYGYMIGFADAITGQIYGAAIYQASGNKHSTRMANAAHTSYTTQFSTTAAGLRESFAIALRSGGAFIFRQSIGGHWLLIAESAWGDDIATLYPTVVNYSAEFSIGSVKINRDNLWLPSPTLSDSFNRANSTTVIGSSDGAGHLEIAGIGSGGSGKAWTAALGTWGISSNRAYCPTLDGGGSGIVIAESGETDLLWKVNLRRLSGNCGIIVRYADANNYVYAYYDGTNVTLRKVVGGVDSEVIAPVANAQTYYQDFRIYVSGTNFRIDYGNALIGEATISDAGLQTGTKVGLYTTAINNTFEQAAAWPLGTDGRFDSKLNAFAPVRPSHNFLPYGDSKSSADTCYMAWMTSETVEFIESPSRIAAAGEGTVEMQAHVDADLAAATGTPEYILYNLGANDLSSIQSAALDEATWQAAALYIWDAMHAKWPSAKIFAMHVWRRTFNTEADTFAGWLDTAIALRSSFVFSGPDERVFLENGDDGATYTADGTHPNLPGCALTSAQWRSSLGF
jgi:hypothetical protein